VSDAPYRPAGSLDLATALAPYAGPWDERRAAHLLRRAGFGGSPAEIARFARLAPHAAVDALLAFPTASVPPPDFAATEADGAMLGPPRIQRRDAVPAAAEATDVSPLVAARKARMRTFRREAAVLQRWWLERMVATPAPLQEKMTLFWHGHFTTAVVQKGISPQMMLAQNELFRSYALGNVRELTWNVTRDPAMLLYLDNARNLAGRPNENYARELMELFTLGIGNYAERDVREGARALTGWRVRRQTGEAYFAATGHDDGFKTFLGRTGALDARAVVETIFAQPACASFFARKLVRAFVYDDPEPALVARVAAVLRKNDFALKPTLSTILRSNVFHSARAYRALVKSPAEFVVGAQRMLGVAKVDVQTMRALAAMGQTLLYPPNVKGWDGGTAWINSRTMLARENFASALTAAPQLVDDRSWIVAELPPSAQAATTRLIDGILQGDASPAATARIAALLGGASQGVSGALSSENFEERMRGAAYLAMATPAYQLN